MNSLRIQVISNLSHRLTGLKFLSSSFLYNRLDIFIPKSNFRFFLSLSMHLFFLSIFTCSTDEICPIMHKCVDTYFLLESIWKQLDPSLDDRYCNLFHSQANLYVFKKQRIHCHRNFQTFERKNDFSPRTNKSFFLSTKK